jgi:hypothetical protein
MFTAKDDLMLRIICEYALRYEKDEIRTADIIGDATSRGITEDEVHEILDFFTKDFLIHVLYEKSDRIERFMVEKRGLETYARTIEPPVMLTMQVFEAIRDEGVTNSAELINRLSKRPFVIDYALNVLESSGWIKTESLADGSRSIMLSHRTTEK